MLVACDTWEYEKKGIKVFGYCPGYVVTDLAGLRDEKTKRGVKTPEGSARGLLAIAEGKRDSEMGKFLHGEAVGELYPW
jgi:NAD(P)-dependent dehydrogenase (short-subunit alcohol dehydrogenase family)